MKKLIFCISLLLYIGTAFSQKKVPVFISGKEGHKSYRIPAIIALPNGNLLAFCEGRVNNAGDFGHVNIVMKRSNDKGKTWSSLQTVASNGDLQAGNPAPVVDLTDPDFPRGRIFLFYNTGNNHEGEVRKGNGLREVWFKTSTDNGNTWSDAVNITVQVHRPRQPLLNPQYNFTEDWRGYANTPGHAMQFESGKYKGRIFVAANHSAGTPQKDFSDYAAHGFYTDDHGKTFHLSATISIAGSNESTATGLYDGRLMMNSRNQKGDIRARIVSISNDGGATWDSSYFDKVLVDPVNEGSILTLGKKKKESIVAFCNTANINRRDDLTLRISYDNGRTWRNSFLIDKSKEETDGDFTAYSDLVKLGKHKVGVLYERNNYKEVVFTMQRWK